MSKLEESRYDLEAERVALVAGVSTVEKIRAMHDKALYDAVARGIISPAPNWGDMGLLLAAYDELCIRLSEARDEIARLQPKPMVLMAPCAKHQGLPWSFSGSAVTATYPTVRQACPHCHPEEFK